MITQRGDPAILRGAPMPPLLEALLGDTLF